MLRVAWLSLRIATTVALLVASYGFWGGAWAPDGTRFKFSLTSVRHVFEFQAAPSPGTTCSWWARSNPEPSCATSRSWRRVAALLPWPLLVSASGLCALSVVSNLRRRDPRVLGRLAAVLAIGALLLGVTVVPSVLAAFQGLKVQFGSLSFSCACLSPFLLLCTEVGFPSVSRRAA